MRKQIIIKVALIILLFVFPTFVYANIICNDGTRSASCQDCHQGCCSRHGGCTTDYTPPIEEEVITEEPVVEKQTTEEMPEETTESTDKQPEIKTDEKEQETNEDSSDSGDTASTVLGLIVAGGFGYGIAKKRRK